MSRRATMISLATLLGIGACSGAPSKTPSRGSGPQPQRIAYGTDPSQIGELTIPTEGRRPGVVVIIHGGFWRASYDLDLGRPLAADLAQRGYCVWNLEYRRVGGGGGWPATLADVAAGIDHLAELGNDLELDRVVVIGHSAGGQLAAWSAARGSLTTGQVGAGPTVRPRGVVSQAGVLDLVGAAGNQVGGSAVPDLLGGAPDAVPDRYAIASPLARLPIDAAITCVHARRDGNVPYSQSESFVTAARAAGTDAELVTATGDHFSLIDRSSPDWTLVVDRLPRLLGS